MFSDESTRREMLALAETRYPDNQADSHGYETNEQRMFGLLVAVAAVYTDLLIDQTEEESYELVSMETTLIGLRENLELLREK